MRTGLERLVYGLEVTPAMFPGSVNATKLGGSGINISTPTVVLGKQVLHSFYSYPTTNRPIDARLETKLLLPRASLSFVFPFSSISPHPDQSTNERSVVSHLNGSPVIVTVNNPTIKPTTNSPIPFLFFFPVES